MQDFSEIFEKDIKWDSGRSMLSALCAQLENKSLIMRIDKRDHTATIITIPWETSEDPITELDQWKAYYRVPESLRDIFLQCCDEILLSRLDALELLKPYFGQDNVAATLAQMNSVLADDERLRIALGKPSLSQIAYEKFGIKGHTISQVGFRTIIDRNAPRHDVPENLEFRNR